MIYPVLDLIDLPPQIHIRDSNSEALPNMFSLDFASDKAAIEHFFELLLAFRKSTNDAFDEGYGNGYADCCGDKEDEDEQGDEYVF